MNGMIDTPLARHWFMHTSHAAVGIGVAAKAGSRLPPAILPQPPQPERDARTLRVGLIAGQEAAWDLAADQLAGHLLRDDSLEVNRAWDCAHLGIEEDAEFDCLVLLGWPAASNREQIKRIELHCRGGGSLVALRAMHAEIPGWSNFAEEVFGGRQLPGRNCRLLEVDPSESAWHHPVVEGLDNMIAEGEVYRGPRFSPETTVLLTSQTGVPNGPHGIKRALPVAWTTRHEGGRVFCSTLGCDDDFRQPAFLQLIARAVHWAGLVHG